MLRRRLSDNESKSGARRAAHTEQTAERAAELDALLRAARPDPVALDPADSRRILTAALAAARPRTTAVVRATRALILLAPAGAALATALLAYPSGFALVAPSGRPAPGGHAGSLDPAGLATVTRGMRVQHNQPHLARAPLDVAARPRARAARRNIRVERAFYETTWPIPRRGLASLADARPALPSAEAPAISVAPAEANALIGKPRVGAQIAELLVCVTGADTRFDAQAADLTVTVKHREDDAPGFAAASGYCAEPDGSLQWTRVCSSGSDAAPATSACTIHAADDPAGAPAYLSVEVTTAPPANADAAPTSNSLIPSDSSATGTDAAKGPDDDFDQSDDVVLVWDNDDITPLA